ncbi:MAG: DUF3313 domain-containing protein [Planctomycetota bacterium]
MRRKTMASGVVAAAIILSGCAATHQARSVETSGFLKDYSILHEGESGEALLIYKNPNADLSRYDKVLIEPVEIWRAADSELEDFPEEDGQRLGTYLHDALKRELEKDFQIVSEPGNGTLRIRAAITEASGSSAPLNMITTVVPIGIAVSAVTRVATGTAAFVGAASAEGEITDSATGELLFAGVDRRVGTKRIRGSWSQWEDVEEAFNYWAERIRLRLTEGRQK